MSRSGRGGGCGIGGKGQRGCRRRTTAGGATGPGSGPGVHGCVACRRRSGPEWLGRRARRARMLAPARAQQVPGRTSTLGITLCLPVRSLLSYHMRRLANPDNLATTLRPRRMDGRGPRCGPARVTPLGGGHRTAAYGGRGVRLRYMLTTPATGWRLTAGRRRRWAGRRGTGKGRDRMSGRAGGGPGADAATTCG